MHSLELLKPLFEYIYIKDGITFLIFAWNAYDPKCSNGWQYHNENRISKSYLLLNYRNDNYTEKLPPNTITYEFRAKEVFCVLYFLKTFLVIEILLRLI